MLAEILIRETKRWGLRLERQGDRVAVKGGKCPDELLELLKANKAAILDLLRAEEDGLPRDQRPWVHIGKQVLAGEFDNADGSTRQSVIYGLRRVNHPVCRAALERLGYKTTQ